MIIALGVARPAPGRLADMVEACRRVAVASRADDGCLEYGFHVGLDDPNEVTSVEVWESQEALDEHMKHAHTQDFLTAVADLTDGEPRMQIFTAQST